jgi:hypothetical protein
MKTEMDKAAGESMVTTELSFSEKLRSQGPSSYKVKSPKFHFYKHTTSTEYSL